MTQRQSGRLRALIRGDLGVSPTSRAPDALELAAWLDGRLSAPQAAAVEARLSRDPLWRQAALALFEAHAQELSAAELARAQALVTGRSVDRWHWLRWLAEPSPAWALASLLIVAGFALGFDLGTDQSAREARLLVQVFGELPLL